MDEVELRLLRAFVAAVEEGSFSAAARRLGLTQPSVSRMIRSLEDRLGVVLIRRTTRQFQLTQAGAVLDQHVRRALQQIEAGVTLTRRTARDATAVIVAVKPDSDGGLLGPALELYRRRTGTTPRLLLRDAHQLPDLVRIGQADLCVVSGPIDLSGLDHEDVLCEPRVTMVSSCHPFARAERITVDDLEGEPVAQWPHLPAAIDAYYQGRDSAERPADPRGPEVADLAEVLRLVELGQAVTFLPASVARRFASRAIRAIPTTGLSPSTLRVAWRSHSRDYRLTDLTLAIQDAATALQA